MTEKKTFTIIFLLLGLFLPNTIAGQEVIINVGTRVKLSSKILQENRDILIYLPENYNESNKSYPVLYKLDGSINNMLETVVVTNRLTYSDEITPEMIIVSIENTNRARDMWPTNTEYYPEPNIPGANDFLNFIEYELIPYIKKNYKTGLEKIICGQSLSSVFVLYSFLSKPEIFDAYIVSSGGFPSCEGYFKNLSENAFKLPEKYNGKKVFITHGLKDPLDPEGIILKQMSDFSNTVREKIGHSISYEFIIYNNDGHVPFHSLYDGLKFIYETKD